MRHGTRSGYVGGCRCSECRSVEMAYQRRYYRGHYLALSVPAEGARDHIEWLRGYGLGSKAIAEACNASPATIRLIRLGRFRRLKQSTEARILAVTPEAILDGTRVPADRARRLLRELKDDGYTNRQLARALGVRSTSPPGLYGTHISARTELRIEKLYRRAFLERIA